MDLVKGLIAGLVIMFAFFMLMHAFFWWYFGIGRIVYALEELCKAAGKQPKPSRDNPRVA